MTTPNAGSPLSQHMIDDMVFLARRQETQASRQLPSGSRFRASNGTWRGRSQCAGQRTDLALFGKETRPTWRQAGDVEAGLRRS
jgi:hypothetical protein